MQITFIRHTSVDVPSGTCYGQTDVPLKPSFEEEAAETKIALESLLTKQAIAPSAIYSSPLSRASRLATACGYDTPVLSDALKEISFGDWEMQSFHQLSGPSADKYYSDYLHVAPPQGESWIEVYRRVCNWIDIVKNEHPEDAHLVVFTHGGVIGCASVYAQLYSFQEALSNIPGYGSLRTLSF